MESKNIRTLHGGGPSHPIKPKITPSKTVAPRPRMLPKDKQPMQTPPVRLGGGYIVGKDLNDKRWRCLICSFKNEPELSECSMCQSAKGEQKHKGGKPSAPKAVARAPVPVSVPVGTTIKSKVEGPAGSGLKPGGLPTGARAQNNSKPIVSKVNITGPSKPAAKKS